MMKRWILFFVLLLSNCLFYGNALSETLSLPLQLPATINGTTYQHGAIVISASANDNYGKYYWYYNQTPGQRISSCTLPLNPTVYPPYDRWDIWYTQARWCQENANNPGYCSDSTHWNTFNNSNYGMSSHTLIDGINGQAYSDMDWVSTNSSLCYQGALYESANWNSQFPPVQFSITLEPEAGGSVTVNSQGCQSCPCQYSIEYGSDAVVSATPAEGYALAYLEDNNTQTQYTPTNNSYTFTDVTEGISLTAVFRKILILQSALNNQYFPDSRKLIYSLTLTEATSIAIISGGTLDVKAGIKDSSGNAVADENGSYSFSGYIDIGLVSETNGHAQTNFMFRKQGLAAGTYVLEVTPETAETSIDGSFSVVFIKRPSNSAEFFAGMDALLGDGYENNDYLDVYVKALYPETYETVDDLVASSDYTNGCIPYSNIEPERQCKALVNFYLHEILGNGYLRSDPVIQSTNWMTFDDANENCVADRDYIMVNDVDGVLIYHSNTSFGTPGCNSGKYFYNPSTSIVYRGDADLEDYVSRGDVFVKTGHYGLIHGYDETVNVLDTNWAIPMDGKIRKGTSASRYSDTWKISRPQ